MSGVLARPRWLVPSVVVLAPAIWLACASAAFLYGTGLQDQFGVPTWQWLEYLVLASDNHTVKMWLWGSGIAASAPWFLLLVWWQRRPKLASHPLGWIRSSLSGVTDNHGHAVWMTMREARRLFPGGHRLYGGVVVGEAYRVDEDRVRATPFDPANKRTWGRGGRSGLLIDPCTDGPTHSIVFAGSGGYKTVSAVSTALHWTGSSVVLDPSCEMGPMVEKALIQQKKRVIMLSPKRPKDAERWGVNVLDWIDTKDELAEMHVHTVVSWIWKEDGRVRSSEDDFFEKEAKNLAACLLADMLWDKERATPKTLETLRVGLVSPEPMMRNILRSIYVSSESRMARQLAGSLMELVNETFSGVYANATEGTSWLSVPAFGALVSGDAFKTSELARGNLTVFVQIPLAAMMTTPSLARVLVGSLLNSIYQADGKVRGRVLFLLDEAARLGRMKILETARDAGRKYGITLQMHMQSAAQLEEQWGLQGKRAWYDGVSWRAYSAVQDLATAEELSKSCGNYGVLAFSEGDNTGRQSGQGRGFGSRSRGRNTNVHEIKRALIRPEELTQDVRADELFVLPRGRKPLRCGRAVYFRRSDLTKLVSTSRFTQGGNS